MRNQATKRSWTRAAGHGLVVAIAALLLFAGSAQAAGICTTAEIEEAYRLPDGSLHPAGALTLCYERNFSPVASLYEVRVDTRAVGLYMTRRHTNLETVDDNRPFMMFQRVGYGELRLVGLANPVQDGMLVNYLRYGTHRDAQSHDLVAGLDDPRLVRVLATTL